MILETMLSDSTKLISKFLSSADPNVWKFKQNLLLKREKIFYLLEITLRNQNKVKTKMLNLLWSGDQRKALKRLCDFVTCVHNK